MPDDVAQLSNYDKIDGERRTVDFFTHCQSGSATAILEHLTSLDIHGLKQGRRSPLIVLWRARDYIREQQIHSLSGQKTRPGDGLAAVMAKISCCSNFAVSS